MNILSPITHGGLEVAKTIRELYVEGQTDYAMEPIVRVNKVGQPIRCISDGDAVIFCCRRGEREVELTEAFVEQEFPHFNRKYLENLRFVIFTLYHEKFHHLPVAFAPCGLPNTLGEIVSMAGLRQMRIAESEKFAHVTFFFNGGNHQPMPGEEDVRIPSHRGIPFDQVPELKLKEVSERILDGLQRGVPLIVTNFANGDVIGHTTNRAAKIRCAEVVDFYLGQVVEAGLDEDYVVMVTADHGNLEVLLTEEGHPHVSHTTHLVDFILVNGADGATVDIRNGKLADVAPTILAAMGLNQPEEMSGALLVPRDTWKQDRKVLLIILDGWGCGAADANNPIWLANTPNWDRLLQTHPHSHLLAAQEAVGLQAGKAGNSEAGHLNLGAGRVVLQDDVRMDTALSDGSFFENPVLLSSIDTVRSSGAALHLIGLLTEKSSHGSIEYPLALLKMARKAGLEKVFLHLILDGRSTEPGSAPALLEKLETEIADIGIGQIATVVGRGLALDRDGNYGKVQKAYEAMTLGKGRPAGDWTEVR